MATETAALPDALGKRQVKVKLSDGSEVSVERWAWAKKIDLLRLVGNMEKLTELAEASLTQADRPKISTMSDEDALLIYTEAIKLNVSPGLLKNARALGEELMRIAEGNKNESP